MQRAIKWVLSLLGSIAILCGGFAILHGSLPPASINAWLPAGNLTGARAGAASVLLQDGRLLITGGNGASGALATTEILDPSAGFTAGAAMLNARSNHVAVLLQDGRVLVAGGTGADGSASQSAELFDPVANSWSASGPLMVGRSGATVTLLPSGHVLIAGGTANGAALASLELFDPSSNTFSLVAGTLTSPRENHAAALLPDGRVLIAGGWDGTTLAPVAPATTGPANVLSSTDIFDPSTGTVAPGPALTAPRMNFTATTALDGSVVAIGGTDGVNDLASIDILAPGTGAFALSGAQLATARQGHLAFLLPNNGNILVVGGTTSGASISSAELYTPWTGATSVTGAMASTRSGATGSSLFQMVLTAPVGIDGALLVAGGVDASSPPATLQSAEVYGFATIKTDQSDYPPGAPVTITGSGWQPGEVVQMSLVEVPDLDNDSPILLTATADENGNIINTEFATNIEDLNVHFTLTAVGAVSQAQTTFTDATNTDTAIASDHTPANVGQMVTYTATVTAHTNGAAITQGSVQFYLGGTGCTGGSVGTTFGGLVGLDSNGHAQQTHTFTSATVGTAVWACYQGFGSGGSALLSSGDHLTQVVNAPAVDHFLVVPSTTTPAAGTAFSVTVTAQDASNATVTSYTGTVHFSLTNTDGSATLPANYTFTIGDAGVHTFTNGVTLTVAGAQTINVNDTVTTTITGSANVTVLGPPAISKAFSPASIAVNGTSTITFTLTNANSSVDLTGVAFSDTFPANLAVAATPNAITTCTGATFTPGAGDTSLSFSGGTITKNSNCTASVDVTSATAGTYNNTTGAISSTNGGTGSTSNTATLTVVAPPTISKAFSPTSIPLNGTSTLTITITNPSANVVALTGVGVTDSLPSGMQVATTPSATNTCGGTFSGTTSGSTSLSLSGGSIATNSNCAISVNVTGTSAGALSNTTGNVSSTNGGSGSTANATLTVVAPPTISKAFGASTIVVGAPTSLTFTLTNPNSFADLTGVAFTDTLPTNVVVASPTGASNTCAAGTFSPVAGAGSVSFSGGTITQGTNCTVSVNVTSFTAGGPYQNTTGAISSTNGGTGTTSNTAPLTVNKADTTTTVTSSPTVTFGATSVTLSATVTANAPSVATVSEGTVTFTIKDSTGATTIDTVSGVAVSSGSASTSYDITSPTLYAAGTYRIYAAYVPKSPNPNFNSSSSAGYGTLTINQVTTVSTLTVTPLYYNPTDGTYSATNPAPAACPTPLGSNPACQQYSDRVNLVATLSPDVVLAHSPATSVDFYVGTQKVGSLSAPTSDTSGILYWEIDNVKLLEPTPYGTAPTGQMKPNVLLTLIAATNASQTVTAKFGGIDPNFIVSDPTAPLNIVQEDARVAYSGLYSFGIPQGATSGTITVSTTVWDISNSQFAPSGSTDPAYDPDMGDIRNAQVWFVDRDNPGTTLCGPVNVGLVNAGDITTGQASCSFTGSTTHNYGEYSVGIIVGNYYTRNSSDDNVEVALVPGGPGFITGGGYLVLTNNATGLLNPTPGRKNNFGFTVKYNKQGTNLQGSINTIIRSALGLDGNPCSSSHPGFTTCVFQVKGNKMTSLTTNPNSTGGTATFVGNASVQDVTNPNAQPVSIDGGATFQVLMTDNGSPGSTDTISFQVNAASNKGGGLWFSSNFTGGKTVQQLLGGGNLTVH